MAAQIQYSSFASGRSLVLMGTAVLHAALFYALGNGIRIIPSASDPPQLQATVIDEPQPQRRVERVFEPESVLRLNRQVVVTQPNLPIPEETPAMGGTEQLSIPGPGGGSGEIAQTVAEPPAPTALLYSATRSTDDFYPPMSIRLAEEGVSVVRVCVDAAGALQSPPTISTSSGYARLDAAAHLWARQALRFQPATRGGVAVAACTGFRVNFRLR